MRKIRKTIISNNYDVVKMKVETMNESSFFRETLWDYKKNLIARFRSCKDVYNF